MSNAVQSSLFARLRAHWGIRLLGGFALVGLALQSTAFQPTASKQQSKRITAVSNPILFVTQVPTPGERFASRTSTFANHTTEMDSVPRGGDLMIRYSDGSVRNLTKEAGFGQEGLQTTSAIAVRDPSMHWSGTKAIFSMVVGAAPRQFIREDWYWQLYEVIGLGQGQTAVITKVAGQPLYNNVTPLYDTNDRILFTSDRPRDGQAHLYPQLDEYESTATITGLWQLDPTTKNLRLLNHTPSGLFSPTIDSYGRVIFTRWDHLQRDQQADGSPGNGYMIKTFANETANASQTSNEEKFPESRLGQTSAYGPVTGFTFNLFTPWEMNQDGTAELTLNHIGRHELSFGFLSRSFTNDPNLSDNSNESLIANRKHIRIDGGVFQLKEDPVNRGTYYGIYAREFASMNSGGIIKFNGAPNFNAEQIAITDVSFPEAPPNVPGGRLRDPLPMTNGSLVASHANNTRTEAGIQFRLRELVPNANGVMVAGDALTPGAGIQKSLSWWSPDTLVTYNGPLWEIEPVEVVARTRPTPRVATVETVEKAVMNEEAVDEAALRTWLTNNNLAMIVTRNQTSRDRGDKQQPYNLEVKNGVKTVGNAGKVYELAHYQVFQASQVRGYDRGPGRRSLATPIAPGKNVATTGPAGSVKIATDGSSAAFVPANRALTWQTTDANGEAIVRERVWVTMQPGEIRTCAGCHGENARNQANQPAPVNKPEALRELLRHWKANLANVPSCDETIATNDCDSDGIPNGVEATVGRNPIARDNDVFTNNQLFVMQQYRDFLAREADGPGSTFWTTALANGTQTRASMIDTFTTSGEFDRLTAPMARLYFGTYLRIPDYGGLQFWTDEFRSGRRTLVQIGEAFATAPEFVARYGALSNRAFVNLVYTNVLGRVADQAGSDFWTAELDSGRRTRGAMLTLFSEGDEYRVTRRAEIYTTLLYAGMLRREPSSAEFASMIAAIKGGATVQSQAAVLMALSAYRVRFLP
jgi:hypothetical protein